jgi:hypothetical protein
MGRQVARCDRVCWGLLGFSRVGFARHGTLNGTLGVSTTRTAESAFSGRAPGVALEALPATTPLDGLCL